jgi:predicted nucleotidyltransferase
MSPYHEILKSLVDAEVDFIVGGGVACVLHGVERVTMDVDLAVHMQPENFNRFVTVMGTLGLRSRAPVRPQALLDPAFVRMLIDEKHALVFTFVDPDKPYRQVDVFLTVDMAYESLLPDTEWVELGGYRVRIINRSRLLAIKRAIVPSRLKDKLDIEFLSRHET